jgi:AcrR family transcriptional regulator
MGANAANKLETTPAATSRPGRPALVNTQAILRAAIEIGLDGVTLKQVADRLGVAVPTLYRHVRNRDELVRLAAFQITLARVMPHKPGAHWSELARQYAESLYESFLAEPQLIGELLKGRLGPHAEVDVLEQFLAALDPHGFSLEEGARLFHAIGMVTIGAAAGAIGLNASWAENLPWSMEMRRTLAERDANELPRVRQVLPGLLQTETIPWKPTLERLLAGIAAERGERLPPLNSGTEESAVLSMHPKRRDPR